MFFVSLLKHSVKMGQRLFSNSIGKLYVLFLTSHCNFYRIAERSNIPLACTGGAENYTWWCSCLPLLDIFFSIKNYVEINQGSNLDLQMAFSSLGVIRTFSRGFYWVSLGFTFELRRWLLITVCHYYMMRVLISKDVNALVFWVCL